MRFIEDADDGERSGGENNETVKKCFRKIRITIRKVAEGVGISIGSCKAIFCGILRMKLVAASFILKFVPKHRDHASTIVFIKFGPL